jgi:general secretion pathway protein N
MKLPLRRGAKRKGGFSPTLAGWQASTHAELLWRSARGAGARWAIAGSVLGVLGGLIAFAPAAWLASAVASATNQRLLLADARGTVWSGSALPVLTGGPDSRDASALPGRMQWNVSLSGLTLELRARQECCLNSGTVLRVKPGFARMQATLQPPPDGIVGQWPAAWLAGLGTPWNTLQLGGTLRLSTPALNLESVEGRWRMAGRAEVDLVGVSSRLSTLPTLGSYRLSLAGDGSGNSQITLSTLEGPMQLSGNGSWGAGGVHLRGEAAAAAADEAALSNLLNIIGRRQGARSIIAIG